jgi:hypothetical protein
MDFDVSIWNLSDGQALDELLGCCRQQNRQHGIEPRTTYDLRICGRSGFQRSHVLTPHFHPAARRPPFPNDSAALACTARFAQETTGGWRGWDRAPLSSRRPVPYPRGEEGDRRGDVGAESSCGLEGALREIGSCLVTQSDRVPPFNPCEYRGCRNRLRSRTSLQPYREREGICRGAVPLALADEARRACRAWQG